MKEKAGHFSRQDPSLAEVMGVLFDVMFLDNLATDVEHLNRLNALLTSGQISQKGLPAYEKMRPLQTLLITPSVHLSRIAAQHQRTMPYLISYFLNSLGRDAVSCADLMSYLLFTREYTRALLDIGYNDASERIDEIEEFIYGSDTTHSSTSRKVFTAAAIRGNRPLPSAATPRAYPPAAPRP